MKVTIKEQIAYAKQIEAYARDLEQTDLSTAWAMRGALDKLQGFAPVVRCGSLSAGARVAWAAGYKGHADVERLTWDRMTAGRAADYAAAVLAANGIGPIAPVAVATPEYARSGVYMRRAGVRVPLLTSPQTY